jgi:hypothetical protein
MCVENAGEEENSRVAQCYAPSGEKRKIGSRTIVLVRLILFALIIAAAFRIDD